MNPKFLPLEQHAKIHKIFMNNEKNMPKQHPNHMHKLITNNPQKKA